MSDIDAILKGDADGDAQATDVLVINEVRNLLFANGAAVDNGQDLIARDVQRARDDGIGTYNQVREAFGLAPVTSFAQITSNVTVQNELKAAYGTVDNIDPFEGGLAEDHAPGSSMGQLFTTILSNQFSRLENGDRFFYLNESWTPAELAMFKKGNTLAKVIEANTHVTNLQADVFKFTASISGTVYLDLDHDGNPQTRGELGLAGFTVQLQDTSGDVLATTKTDIFGHYTFTDQSGPSGNPEIAAGASATGDYEVVLVLPSFLTQTAGPGTIHLSRCGMHIDGQNFGVDFNFNGAAGLAFLFDGTGNLVAATTTDSSGHATFTGQTVTSADTVVTLVLHPGAAETANARWARVEEKMEKIDLLDDLERWQACSQGVLANRSPQELFDPSFVERYEQLHRDLWHRLIHVHGTLSTLERLEKFPFAALYGPHDMEFWRLVTDNFFITAVVMLRALVGDPNPRHRGADQLKRVAVEKERRRSAASRAS